MLIWQNRIFRVIFLGVSVLLVLIFLFFSYNNEQSKSPEKSASGGAGFNLQPLSQGFSVVGADIEQAAGWDNLKKYPAPENFRYFQYPQNSISVSDRCADDYYTVLIFSADVDYRQSPERAVFNTAFNCRSGEKFERRINLSALDLKPGRYYYFAADQGQETMWYNPR